MFILSYGKACQAQKSQECIQYCFCHDLAGPLEASEKVEVREKIVFHCKCKQILCVSVHEPEQILQNHKI